ncbi:hypothetical protein Zm00014a_022452 [Zea mays]|uniref:Uncharacterized protein n=1 Tax=Zea mays TaxID=4577 RepID=A0A317Y6L0_MAIZE|nr:hypothetical protein Zm00014a_022452 [Zea mays]
MPLTQEVLDKIVTI